MLIINNALTNNLKELGRLTIEYMEQEIISTELNYTGKLKNMELLVASSLPGIIADVLMEDYGIIINKGYSAEDARKRTLYFGKTDYIEDLTEWFQSKLGLAGNQAKGAAIATWLNHLNNGYPSRRSGTGDEGFIDFVSRIILRIAEDVIMDNDIIYAIVNQIKVNTPVLGRNLFVI